MAINWKRRIRSKQFWMGVIGATGVLVISVAGLLGHGEDAATLVDSLENVASAVLALLALLGVVVDPTTSGFGDDSPEDPDDLDSS